jgi:tRNA(Ile)-lysidine synthase
MCWNEYNEVVITGSFPVIARYEVPKQSDFPFLSCTFPVLQGEFPLNVPGETILPAWRVIANVSPASAQSSHVIASQSPKYSEVRSHPVIASAAKQSHKSFVADFDLRQAGIELLVRQRRPGDRFQPLGMDMPKKLQDFMVDAKIPLSWRGHIPLVCSPGQIVWVVGYRIDDRVKVTRATKEILRLEFQRK